MNQPALKYDLEWSMVHPEVLDNCWDECCEMWIVYDTVSLNIIGCSITFLKEYPTGLRMLHIDHIAGIKMNWWLEDGLEMLSHFAKKNGYDGIEGIGRTGFWNWFKNMGWRKHATFFEIRLQE